MYCRSDDFTRKGSRHWCEECGRLHYDAPVGRAVLIEAFVNAPRNLKPEPGELTEPCNCQFEDCKADAIGTIEPGRHEYAVCTHHWRTSLALVLAAKAFLYGVFLAFILGSLYVFTGLAPAA